MAKTFKRLATRDVGPARVRIGAYTATGAGTQVIVIGMSVANKLASPVKVTLEHHDGVSYTLIVKEAVIAPGQSFAPVGEINKLILQAGDGIFATSDAVAGLDVVTSILEITA